MMRLVSFVLALLAAAAPAAAQDQNFFPLQKGTYWVYRATVKWENANTHRTEEKVVPDWTMRVEETITRDWVTAAVISGHPSELTGVYAEGGQPGRRVLVVVGGTRFFLAENGDEVLQRMRRGGDDLQGLVTEDDLVLELPLRAGQHAGPVEMLTRLDEMYKWLVESEARRPMTGVGGVSPAESRTWYVLTHRADSDQQTVTYVAGVGIADYSDTRHGTRTASEARLVEFHSGTSPAGK